MPRVILSHGLCRYGGNPGSATRASDLGHPWCWRAHVHGTRMLTAPKTTVFSDSVVFLLLHKLGARWGKRPRPRQCKGLSFWVIGWWLPFAMPGRQPLVEAALTLTCLVTWGRDGVIRYLLPYRLASLVCGVAILNGLLQRHKSVPILPASRWLQMRSLFWQFHRRTPNSLNKPLHTLDHPEQLWDKRWTWTKTLGSVKHHRGFLSDSPHPGKPRARMEKIGLTPLPASSSPGCWNCLGGSDDLIRGGQLSQTSVISSSIEKHLGSLDADILGTLCISHQFQECVASHVAPKVTLEIHRIRASTGTTYHLGWEIGQAYIFLSSSRGRPLCLGF